MLLLLHSYLMDRGAWGATVYELQRDNTEHACTTVTPLIHSFIQLVPIGHLLFVDQELL